jgi:hypothetical protein
MRCPPAFSLFFDTRDEMPLTDSLIMIPEQDPAPERAWRSWIEVQKGWGKGWTTGISFHSSLGYKLLSGGLNPTGEPADTVQTAGVFLGGQKFQPGTETLVRVPLGMAGHKSRLPVRIS